MIRSSQRPSSPLGNERLLGKGMVPAEPVPADDQVLLHVTPHVVVQHGRQSQIDAFIADHLHALHFGPTFAHGVEHRLPGGPFHQVRTLLADDVAGAGAGLGVRLLRQLPVKQDIFPQVLIPDDAGIPAAAPAAKATGHLVPGEAVGAVGHPVPATETAPVPVIRGNAAGEEPAFRRPFSRVLDQPNGAGKGTVPQMVRVAQDVVVHRSLVADQSQVRFHPGHAVRALGVGGHVAAGMLLDLVPDLELPVLGIVDGGAELDSPAFPGGLLPGCVRLHQWICGMFFEHGLNPLHVVPGGEHVVVHQKLLPVADLQRRFRFQWRQVDMGRSGILRCSRVRRREKRKRRHKSERLQKHVESRPFRSESESGRRSNVGNGHVPLDVHLDELLGFLVE